MNIYRIWQEVNFDYDTYDSAIVCSISAKKAKYIYPSGDTEWDGKKDLMRSWCTVEDVQVEYIGIAGEKQTEGVILASFNAG